jgi:hypothetical protein
MASGMQTHSHLPLSSYKQTLNTMAELCKFVRLCRCMHGWQQHNEKASAGAASTRSKTVQARLTEAPRRLEVEPLSAAESSAGAVAAASSVGTSVDLEGVAMGGAGPAPSLFNNFATMFATVGHIL